MGRKQLAPTVCGTIRAYRQGCRCLDCKKANSAKSRFYNTVKAVQATEHYHLPFKD